MNGETTHESCQGTRATDDDGDGKEREEEEQVVKKLSQRAILFSKTCFVLSFRSIIHCGSSYANQSTFQFQLNFDCHCQT